MKIDDINTQTKNKNEEGLHSIIACCFFTRGVTGGLGTALVLLGCAFPFTATAAITSVLEFVERSMLFFRR